MPNPAELRLDALVVGGGPAGATAALLLARRGWQVGLIEKGGAGRDKCCGHCLSARAWPLIDRLGLRPIVDAATVGATSAVRLEVGALAAGGPRQARAPRSLVLQLAGGAQGTGAAERNGRLVERRILDTRLLDAAESAGVRVLRASAARVVGASPWLVEARPIPGDRGGAPTLLEAALLLGADGLGSSVARSLGWAPRRPGRSFGFSAELPAGAMSGLADDDVAMHLLSSGYLGAARRADGSVHLAALVRSAEAPRRPQEFLAAMIAAFPDSFRGVAPGDVVARGSWLAAGPMPWRPRRVAAPGAALLGDAAGYVEPFTGEGMAWAFESAAILAESLASKTRTFGAQEAARYAALWRQRIGAGQARCAMLTALLKRPSLLRCAVGVAPAMARRLAAAVHGASRATSAVPAPPLRGGGRGAAA